MSSGTNVTTLAERTDIHKSCKSLETLLNILNDYCEAAGAVVLLQKKLAKALREAAGTKVTGVIPGNAMNSSATIFETLSEIDSKFAKLADKEYDNISAEVKKWFKKLAKEEKAHDDWIANSNARIKQAGMAYEKKSKKSPRDAEEEHARYINLLSSLGPEMSQEKYNHALQVTQRHTFTTYNVAACLSRIADAEWLRACECIRRVSPTVGQLGEWRALCEGGWTGLTPLGLPDVDQPQTDVAEQVVSNDEPSQPYSNPSTDVRRRDDPRPNTIEAVPVSQNDRAPPSPNPKSARPEPTGTMRSNYASSSSSSVPPSSFEPPRPLTDPNTGSVRSLSAFPAPPTHFPIPPLRRPSLTQRPPDLAQSPTTSAPHDQSRAPSSSASNISFPSMPRMSESPIPVEGLEIEDQRANGAEALSPPGYSPVPSGPSEQHHQERSPATTPGDVRRDEAQAPSPQQQPRRQNTADARALESTPAIPVRSSSPRPNEDTFDERDLGRRGPAPDTPRVRAIDRNDTGASSIVATMKSRIASGSGGRSTSPPPKDIPRLPLSVVDLASRYQPNDGPASSPVRLRSNSPPISRRLSSPPLDTVAQARLAETAFREANAALSTRATSSSSVTPIPDRRSQRADEHAEMALAEKERQLQMREREIEMKVKELERDRARLLGDRGVSGHGRDSRGEPSSPRMETRERRTSFDTNAAASPRSSQPIPRSQYSYSTTHLVPPSSAPYPSSQSRHSSSSYATSNPNSQPPSPQLSQAPSDHAPYCGCDKCSIAKYKSSPKALSPQDLRVEKPITLRPEKPKGWIRRLSMPVGNPFAMDHKRNNSIGIGALSLDGKKNASSTALRGIQEDGRMRVGGEVTYEAGGGISNRSVASFTLSGQR